MRKLLHSLKRDERGVSALEYAILAGIIVVAVAAGVATLGGHVEGLFGDANEAIAKATSDEE